MSFHISLALIFIIEINGGKAAKFQILLYFPQFGLLNPDHCMLISLLYTQLKGYIISIKGIQSSLVLGGKPGTCFWKESS